MSRINGIVPHTVYLGQGGIGDKLIIGKAGYIDPIVSPGAAGVVSDVTGGKIVNHGTVYGGSVGYKGSVVGGTGIELQAQGTVTNAGKVAGGYGGKYLAGGVGIDLAAGGMVKNSGSVAGGFGGVQGNGGDGMDLRAGGTLTNHGVIAGGDGNGGYTAVGSGGIGVLLGGAGSIMNAGMIRGGDGAGGYYKVPAGSGGAGLELSAGTLTNSAAISGGAGGYSRYFAGNGGQGMTQSGGTVADHGTITGGAGGGSDVYTGGTGGTGVTLTGGSLANAGTIEGGVGGYSRFLGGTGGLGVTLYGGTLTNEGKIVGGDAGPTYTFAGSGGAGAAIYGGTLVNAGHITGGYTQQGDYPGANGVYIDGGTLTTSGTIARGAGASKYNYGEAVKFGSAAATLVLDPGAGFTGDVVADGKNDTLVLAAGSLAGQLYGLGGAAFGGFTTATESAGATWNLTGTTNLSGTKLDVAGTLTFTGAVAHSSGGHGSVTLDSGAAVTADGSLGVPSVVFGAGGGELLALGAPTAVTSTLSGFGTGDTIDLVKLMANGVAFSNGTLSLLENSSVVATLALAGNYTSANFTLTSDGHGGTDIGYVTQGADVAPPEAGWMHSGESHELGWGREHLVGSGGTNWGLVVAEHGHLAI